MQYKVPRVVCDDFTNVELKNPDRAYSGFVISFFNVGGDLPFSKNQTLAGLRVEMRNGEIYSNTSRPVRVMSVEKSSNTNSYLAEFAYIAQPSTNSADTQYLHWANKILEEGAHSGNRTATDTIKLFGDAQMKFDLREGLPVLTTKQVNVGALKKELCWFMRGETNIKTLGSAIWNEWATPEGELGPVYGEQWRDWLSWHEVHESQSEKISFLEEQGYTKGYQVSGFLLYHKRIDQIANLVNELKTNPNNRRMIVTAWNPSVDPDTKLSPNKNAELGMQALPPCHTLWQVGCTCIPTQTEREAEWLRLQAIKTMHEMSVSFDEGYVLSHNLWALHVSDTMKEIEETSEEVVLKAALDKVNAPEYYLDLKLYQRSADWFLGVPFNIASYAMLAEILATHTGHVARNFYHTFGDFHIYENHVEQIKIQMQQEQKALPRCHIKPKQDISHYTHEDIHVLGYQGGIKLTGAVAV